MSAAGLVDAFEGVHGSPPGRIAGSPSTVTAKGASPPDEARAIFEALLTFTGDALRDRHARSLQAKREMLVLQVRGHVDDVAHDQADAFAMAMRSRAAVAWG